MEVEAGDEPTVSRVEELPATTFKPDPDVEDQVADLNSLIEEDNNEMDAQ